VSDGNNYGILNIYKFISYCKNVFLHLKDSVILEIIFQIFFYCPKLCVTKYSFGFGKLVVSLS